MVIQILCENFLNIALHKKKRLQYFAIGLLFNNKISFFNDSIDPIIYRIYIYIGKYRM